MYLNKIIIFGNYVRGLHKADYKKINKQRRNRGYDFEHTLIQDFIDNGWYARRLGGSSTGLPDVMATKGDRVLSIECKSVISNLAYIPQDQIERCVTTLQLFSYYPKKNVIFAFKFGQKKGVKLKEYFFNGDGFSWVSTFKNVEFVRCRRNGELFVKFRDGFKPAVNQIHPEVGHPMTFSQLINPNYTL